MSTPYDPQTVWQTAYGDLQLQMPRETFDTWLRTARLLAHEDGTFIVGVENTYARDWLEHRLKKVVLRTLNQIAGRTVEVRFVLWNETPDLSDLAEAGPLLAPLAAKEEESPRFERLESGENGLNPRYTFETFAIGPSNRLAHAAALAVVDAPGMQFNPLYLHAEVGMGKSHLLHAIGHACAEAGFRVLYVSSETFTNDLVASINGRNTAQFREKYRDVEVLLVDDIQFIAGKDSTQEEFVHTFNDLFNANAQIVVTSRERPEDIKKLDPRLRSRFEGGLVVELLPPDYATRIEILEIKAQLRGFDDRLPPDVLAVIAGENNASARDLEGALNRVIAASLLTDQMPTMAMLETLVQPPRPAHDPAIALDDIIMAVADFYEISPDDLMGRGRSREVSVARQVAMYLAREVADSPLQQIGEVLGGRNHSTVLYSCERIAELVAIDSEIGRQVRAIRRVLQPQGGIPVESDDAQSAD